MPVMRISEDSFSYMSGTDHSDVPESPKNHKGNEILELD